MELTDAKSDDPNMAMGIEMMKGTTTEIYFVDGKYMTEMSMMGGMVNMKNVVNTESKNMDMFMDAMGSKMWIETNMDEAKEMNKQNATDMSQLKVEYDKSQTKKILGYTAHKATINMPNNAGKIEGWVTNEIITDANVIQGMEDLKLEGFPLEFTMNTPQMTLTFSTTDIKESVDKSKFDIKTDGYKKMTMEEFQKSMGGMGGGLGF